METVRKVNFAAHFCKSLTLRTVLIGLRLTCGRKVKCSEVNKMQLSFSYSFANTLTTYRFK